MATGGDGSGSVNQVFHPIDLHSVLRPSLIPWLISNLSIPITQLSITTNSVQGAHLRGGVRSTSSRLREDLQAVVNSLHLINLMACVQLICYCSPSLNAFVGLWLENISCDDDICGKNWANRCQMVTRPVGWLKLPASPIGFCQFCCRTPS